MEHNKNGMLALMVLFVGLAFFVFGMVYHLWGTVLKINNNPFKKKYSYEYFFLKMSCKNILNLLTCIQSPMIVI
ncbi:hypothetical protein ACT7DL_24160 [Bacillus paranthracis]